MINPLSTSLSGMMAASKKAHVAATNIANADVVGSTDPTNPSQAYAAKTTQNVSGAAGEVRTNVINRNPPFVQSFAPDSPFADANGLVNAPNVSLDEELMTTKIAEHAYKANLAALKTSMDMHDTLREALDTNA